MCVLQYVLQCVAVCEAVCVAVCVAVCGNMWQYVLQCVAVCVAVFVAVCCSLCCSLCCSVCCSVCCSLCCSVCCSVSPLSNLPHMIQRMTSGVCYSTCACMHVCVCGCKRVCTCMYVCVYTCECTCVCVSNLSPFPSLSSFWLPLSNHPRPPNIHAISLPLPPIFSTHPPPQHAMGWLPVVGSFKL